MREANGLLQKRECYLKLRSLDCLGSAILPFDREHQREASVTALRKETKHLLSLSLSLLLLLSMHFPFDFHKMQSKNNFHGNNQLHATGLSYHAAQEHHHHHHPQPPHTHPGKGNPTRGTLSAKSHNMNNHRTFYATTNPQRPQRDGH